MDDPSLPTATHANVNNDIKGNADQKQQLGGHGHGQDDQEGEKKALLKVVWDLRQQLDSFSEQKERLMMEERGKLLETFNAEKDYRRV